MFVPQIIMLWLSQKHYKANYPSVEKSAEGFLLYILCLWLIYDIMNQIEFMVVQRLNSHKRKMIAPIIITVIMILYYITYFGFLISLLDGIWKYALGIIPLVFSGIMIYVCIERINEIKKGEEDDISKY